MEGNSFIELIQEIALGFSIVLSMWFYKKYKKFLIEIQNEDLLEQLCNNKKENPV